MDASPDLYPVALDVETGRVQVVRLDEAGYRDASFLDERILPRTGPGVWAPWAELEGAAGGLTGESDFIFHIGHVGSTLLARLLGEADRVFALREPAILRTLATMETPRVDPYLGTLLRLYARVWRPGQKSLIKATSFVSDLAPLMLERSISAKAILMFVSPMTYMTTILAGPASRGALRGEAVGRLERLRRRLGEAPWTLGGLTEGELAAMSWACEIRALADAADRYPGRVLWLDFDDFLARPAAGLAAALNRLHGEAPPALIETLLSGPHLTRYSKAPEHPYDPGLRRRILAQGRIEHRLELERGVAWLNAAGTRYPLIADAARAAASAPRLG